jgi:hypothetical protein
MRLGRVVSRPVTHLKAGICGQPSDRYLDVAKLRIRKALRRIVRQQILGTQFIADLAKGFVELRQRRRVEILAAGVGGKLDQACSPPVSRPALASIGTTIML